MSHRVAVLPGDGVGPEVVNEAVKAVEATGVEISWQVFDWGSDHYHRTGLMAPEGFTDELEKHDAILMGAVGDPSVPDHVSLWGLLLPIRQRLDLWANLRPARLLEGVPGVLEGREPSEVDMLFVRENSEGEYSGVGGRAHEGMSHEVGLETSVFTRAGLERVLEHAFVLAESRRGQVVSATKSNASRYGYVLWDEVATETAERHPGVTYERVLVDALAARMISNPGSLDVVVASNLFGDILTDIGAVIQGGMGVAASANLRPDRPDIGLFEPVHGSAPDIAGQGIANPAGGIWSAAMMLEHLGEEAAAARVHEALASVCKSGPRTRDLGGSGSTVEVGDAVAAAVAAGTELS